MSPDEVRRTLRTVCKEQLPLPGSGNTATRHRRLMELGRENLTVARLAEAHWDAIAILAEAGRLPRPGAVYGVWASEAPGKELVLSPTGSGYQVSGVKGFCSGAGIVDRALVTVALPEQKLVELDLGNCAAHIEIDMTTWKTEALRDTQTATVTFQGVDLPKEDVVGGTGWYIDRPGFWSGACGPAACWAGGVAGLLDVAMHSSRADSHTLAHLGAMYSNIWAMAAYLELAGREIDRLTDQPCSGQVLALSMRHLVEQACSDTLHRFARAYGPAPLCTNAETSLRYYEAELYLRQCHGERDLESLGRVLKDGC